MKRSNSKKTGIGIIAFVVLMLFATVTYRRIGLEEESNKAELTIEQLQAQIAEEEDRATDISNMKAYAQTKQYIEDMARDKLGLVYKDEILFQPEE
ncbi:MAG: septum formation initiator family protein [Mobilitalea sp.]